jgi:hypothetical protein
MAATPDDLIAALDRLTKSIQQAMRPGQPRPRQDNSGELPGPLGEASGIVGDVNEGMYAAGDLSSGSVGRVFRGLRSASKLWDRYTPKGGAAAEGEVAAGAEGAEAGAAAAGGGEAAGAAGAAGAAAAGGPIGLAVLAVVAVLASLVIAFRKFQTHVEEATDELIRDQAKLAEVSGGMAAVFAEREMQELRRDREKGNRLSTSARYLVEGEQQRKDKEVNFEVLGTKVSNYIEGFANRFLAGLYDPFDGILGKMDELIKWLEKVFGIKVEDMREQMQAIEDRERNRLEDGKLQRQKAAQAVDQGRFGQPLGHPQGRR